MKYLLDTHGVIWYFENSMKLSKKAKDLIDNPEISIYICSVSLWEISIKMGLGKLDVSFMLEELLHDIKIRNFDILQIEDQYLKKLLNLPLIHKDPFDRLLISSALIENLTIITIDENIQKYDVPWVW